MSTGVIAAILVVVIIVIIAVFVLGRPAVRGKKLRQRFGPEYDRVLAEQGSKRKADAELAGRERRVRGLDIHPLTEAARASYLTRWASTQELFVDEPDAAVEAARQIVSQAITDRGYPAESHAQTLADLSVDHARALEHYRAACALSETTSNGSATNGTAANGTAANGMVNGAVSTEDRRQALINYREMFDDLIGEQSTPATLALPPGTGPALAIPAPVSTANDDPAGTAIDDDDAETITTQERHAR